MICKKHIHINRHYTYLCGLSLVSFLGRDNTIISKFKVSKLATHTHNGNTQRTEADGGRSERKIEKQTSLHLPLFLPFLLSLQFLIHFNVELERIPPGGNNKRNKRSSSWQKTLEYWIGLGIIWTGTSVPRNTHIQCYTETCSRYIQLRIEFAIGQRVGSTFHLYFFFIFLMILSSLETGSMFGFH